MSCKLDFLKFSEFKIQQEWRDICLRLSVCRHRPSASKIAHVNKHTTPYLEKNCTLSSRLVANPPTLQRSQHFPRKDGSLLSSSRAKICQTHCSPQREADLSSQGMCWDDWSLIDFQASLVSAGLERFRKVGFRYFCQKLWICENRKVSVAMCVPVLTGRVSWAQRFLDRKNTLTETVHHWVTITSQSRNNSNCVSSLGVCIAPNKSYLPGFSHLVELYIFLAACLVFSHGKKGF